MASTKAWNEEAADMVEELTRTQLEVAAMLAEHEASHAELAHLRGEAQQEVGDQRMALPPSAGTPSARGMP